LSERRWLQCSQCGRAVRDDATQTRRCPGCDSRLKAPRGAVEGLPVRDLFARPLLRLTGYLVDTAAIAPITIAALFWAARLEATGRAGPGVLLSAFTAATIVSVVYFIVPTAIWGQTAGKWFAGIQVIGPDGRVAGWGRSLVRAIVGVIADLLANTLVVGILDPLWLLWHRNRQTLHDLAAGTVVIPVRRRQPALTFFAGLLLSIGVQVGLMFAVIWPLVLQAYYVPSASMHPTLLEHDRLLVNKRSYRDGELRRGDIVVFVAPKSAYYANPTENPNLNERKDFIKRLVALPGDTAKVRDGRLWIRERGETALHAIEEPYLRDARIDRDWGPVTVPEGHALVFGDNRNNSNDSTRWVVPATDTRGRLRDRPAPFLPIENIHGRAIFRYWPPWRWGELPRREH
jgi:signal peptidase I